jgi:hypothetical protein
MTIPQRAITSINNIASTTVTGQPIAQIGTAMIAKPKLILARTAGGSQATNVTKSKFLQTIHSLDLPNSLSWVLAHSKKLFASPIYFVCNPA